MYCLDTDLIIAFMRGDSEAKSFLASQGDDELSVSAIVLCELFKGAFMSKRKEMGIEYVNQVTRNLRIITESRESCFLYGSYFSKLKEQGKIVGEMDLLIASVCKANNLILVTRNVKDFQNIPDLKIQKW